MKIEPTVPISEFGLTCLTGADREAWARTAGVRIVEDYLGREAVTLADAYKVRQHAKSAEQEFRRQQDAISTAHNAQIRRDEVFATAYGQAIKKSRHGMSPSEAVVEAQRAAWRAVAEAEADLPAEVCERLTAPQRLSFDFAS